MTIFSLEVAFVGTGAADVEDMLGGRRRDGGCEAPKHLRVTRQFRKGNPPAPGSTFISDWSGLALDLSSRLILL